MTTGVGGGGGFVAPGGGGTSGGGGVAAAGGGAGVGVGAGAAAGGGGAGTWAAACCAVAPRSANVVLMTVSNRDVTRLIGSLLVMSSSMCEPRTDLSLGQPRELETSPRPRRSDPVARLSPQIIVSRCRAYFADINVCGISAASHEAPCRVATWCS